MYKRQVTSPDIPENAEKITPAGTVADGIFTPSTEGTTVTVTASRGDVSANIQIKIDAYPFVDMKDHWAVKEIYKLYKTGVVKGEIAEDGTAYYLSLIHISLPSALFQRPHGLQNGFSQLERTVFRRRRTRCV